LGDNILHTKKDFATKSITDALEIMKSFAVVPVARGVLCFKLAAMRQSADEPFRNFAAKVCGKAETCNFKVECGSCKQDVYYTDEVTCNVLLHGIADNDLRHDALGAAEIQTKLVANVIALVKGKETGRDANPPTATNAASSYPRTHSAKEPNSATPNQRSTHSDAGG
jgi:hypothetical protein